MKNQKPNELGKIFALAEKEFENRQAERRIRMNALKMKWTNGDSRCVRSSSRRISIADDIGNKKQPRNDAGLLNLTV